MKKRFASAVGIVSAVAMLMSGAVGASAREATDLNNLITNSYVALNGNGMTFEKVSHPTKGLETTDGVVDYVGGGNIDTLADGEGDRGQSYSYAAQSEGDWVYIGTMYGGLGVNAILNSGIGGMGISPEAASSLIDAMYSGHMYKGEPDGKSAGGVLFKFNVKTGETKILMSQSQGIDGGTGIIPTFRSAYKMNGKLYFVGMIMDTNNPELTQREIQMAMAMQNGFPCVYEIDPNNGDKLTRVYNSVDVNGFRQLVNNKVFTSTRALGSFGNTLIAGDVKLPPMAATHRSWPSNNPSDPSSWKTIADSATFDNLPAVKRSDVNGGGGIYQVQEYNGKLYVVICMGSADTENEETGTKRSFAIYVGENHGDATNAADWSWRALAGDTQKGARYSYGLDPERIAAGACTLQVYGDHLYIGDYNDVSSALQGFATHQEFVTQATNLEQSINLYRMDANENVEMLVGDPTEQFPQGGSTGLGSGFDNHMNQYTWQTTVHEGKMYLSTMNTTTLLEPMAQFTNGDILHMSKQEWTTTLNALRTFVEILIKDAQKPAVYSLREGETGETVEATEAKPSADDPEALVDWAVARANDNAGKSGASMFSVQEAEPVTLSDADRATLVDGIRDGSIVPDSVGDAQTIDDLYRINDSLGSLSAALDETASEDFSNTYGELVDLAASIDGVPESFTKMMETLLKLASARNLAAFFKSLPYLAKSKRGFNLFEITDNGNGVQISTVSDDGFGDRFNHGLRIFCPTDDYLLVGTANPFYGTQLWRVANTETKPDDPDTPDTPDTPVDPSDPGTDPAEPAAPGETPDNPDAGTGADDGSHDGANGQESPLATTGSSVLGLAIAGIVALALGVGLLVARKRKLA
ncbi:hypothetical protein BMAGN_0250 [Bifidobacterium magnum]|uniref:Gram-positive cocci surface proteins LPxTG domain-containing protein n=4 Tax=Bifidobacterium magnum TaxID=1692 RepID=A0A087BB98_9BIFI|nr:hypothetical protein BMAGN_0250 [Bifidobacterium magnum]